MNSIIVPKLLANAELILQTSIAMDWSVYNAFRNCFWKGFSRSASACKTNMLFGVRNTSRCSFLTSNMTRTLYTGASNFTEYVQQLLRGMPCEWDRITSYGLFSCPLHQ